MKKETSNKLFIKTIVFSFVILLMGCTSPPLYTSYQPLEDGWTLNDTISFETNIKDTINTFNFFFHLRHYSTYPYSNFFTYAKTTFPNGKTRTDTIECILAMKNGQWTGRGLGDILDNKVLFRYKKRFPLSGKYKFDFIHGMRDTTISSILNVGFSIEQENE